MANHSQRSKSFLAAEAIATYGEAEDWQLEEVVAGLAELDSGKMVEPEKVGRWRRMPTAIGRDFWPRRVRAIPTGSTWWEKVRAGTSAIRMRASWPTTPRCRSRHARR